MACQLTNMCELAVRNPWLNNLFQDRIKLVWSTKKKALFIKNKIFRFLVMKSEKTALGEYGAFQILPGDIIKVRSKEEIQSILDDWGGYKGCTFTPEMYEYCDKTFKVLKRIDYFYDEIKEKMCKCKNIVILEGVTCSGQRRMFSESCDRNCFLFWHLSWLEKV